MHTLNQYQHFFLNENATDKSENKTGSLYTIAFNRIVSIKKAIKTVTRSDQWKQRYYF